MSSRTVFLRIIVAVAALAASAGKLDAADLWSLFSNDTPQTNIPPVEFGSGWYIRGSVDGALQTQPSLLADFTSVPSVQNLNWAAELGGGYQFNQWFRVDATYTYYEEQKASGDGAQVNCPASLNPVYNSDDTLIGVTADPSQCTPEESASLQKNLFLANGYVDLGTWGP